MTRWEAFTTVCAFLRAELLRGERQPAREINWELMIEVASFHFVTPALARCLGTDANVPADVRDYFDSAVALNRQRNDSMLSGLARVAGLLNSIDIDPVLLKGAAHLVGDTYPEPSLRILGDVDVLIPANRSTDAVAALQAAGFGTKPDDAVPPPTHHHLPVLRDPDGGIAVELHTDVIDRSPDHVISTAWFCEMTRPALFRTQRVRLPEPTRNAGHTIYHSQIFHGIYTRDKIQLRHFLDLALIRSRHEGAIDWAELDCRFSAAGFGEMLATYLYFAEELLGQPAPKLSHAPQRDGMAKLRNMESRDSFHVQIEDLKKQCDVLQTAFSNMTVSRDRLQSEIDRLEVERSALQAVVAAQAQMQRELDTVTAERVKLERDLAVVLKSRSWRLTAPLRAIAAASRRWLR